MEDKRVEETEEEMEQDEKVEMKEEIVGGRWMEVREEQEAP